MMAEKQGEKLYDRERDGDATISVTRGGKKEELENVVSVESSPGGVVVNTKSGWWLWEEKETKIINDAEVTIKKKS